MEGRKFGKSTENDDHVYRKQLGRGNVENQERKDR